MSDALVVELIGLLVIRVAVMLPLSLRGTQLRVRAHSWLAEQPVVRAANQPATISSLFLHLQVFEQLLDPIQVQLQDQFGASTRLS